ncbi:MAG: butanediol dehydrogenase, partial [Staphylococcus epidermidis]|nr:butanediol dehydrogenase [Staphylococcus epidermidis]
FGHPVEFNPLLQMNKGVKLTTTIAYTPTTFQQTIDLIANGSLNVKDVVTDQIELDNIVESGFNQLVNDKSQAKILVRLNGDQK